MRSKERPRKSPAYQSKIVVRRRAVPPTRLQEYLPRVSKAVAGIRVGDKLKICCRIFASLS